MAANLEWILGREGPDAKILIYASRYHISASPARQARDSLGNQVLGVFLRHRYGARMVNIGNLINKGGWGCHRSNALTPATAASLDGTVATLGQTNLILDLRSAPRGWLDRVIPLGSDGFIELRPAEAFDLLWYIDSVRPACA